MMCPAIGRSGQAHQFGEFNDEVRRGLREIRQQLRGLCAGPARLYLNWQDSRRYGASHREAIAFHIDGLREQGEAVPEPVTWAELVEV
jgi:hypothetical protein